MSKYEEQREEYKKRKQQDGNNDPKRYVQKLGVFNELIKQLVNWKTEKEGQREEDVLKDLSFIPLMKCLYFVCLLSIHNTSKIADTLFNLFDFTAYPNGWVDEDCYYSIDDLKDYHIDTNEDGKEYITKRECGLNEIDVPDISMYEKELEDAVNDLKEALFFPSFRNRESLIALSHDELWEKAYSETNGKLDTSDWNKVYEMAKYFRMSIAA